MLAQREQAQVQPRSITRSEYARWGWKDIATDQMSLERLLLAADAAHDHLWRKFIGPQGSVGISTDDPLDGLKEQVVHFMFETPPSDLLAQLRRGEEINWKQVAQRGNLPAVRDGLDELPVFDSNEGDRSDCPISICSQKLCQVTVNGRDRLVNEPQRNVIRALVEAYPNTVTKDELVANSGHEDAVNILKRLKKRDSDWAAVVQLVGSTGGGYSIVRPAQTSGKARQSFRLVHTFSHTSHTFSTTITTVGTRMLG